jgi:AraC-like DNA-binding protein
LIFFVTILGFVIALLVLLNRVEKFGPNFYLALFIFFNSFYAVTSFSFVSNEFRWIITKLYPFIILPNMAAGPFMYLFFVHTFNSNFKFKPIHLLHFVPSIIFFVNGSDYLFWDSTEKAFLIKKFMTNSGAVFAMPTLIFDYYWHVLFRMLQTFVYVILSARLFYVNFKSIGFKLNTDNQIPYRYLLFFLVFFIFHFLTTLVIGIRVNPKVDNLLGNLGELNTLISSSRTAFTLFILTTLFHPKVVFEKFFDVKKIKTIKRSKIDSEFESGTVESAKYDLVEIDRVFTEHMLSQPYLQPGFSLSTLSDEIKVPVHQISYYIKHRYSQTFNEWKNEIRVQYAVGLINDGKADLLTLESISIQCGYRSRANFIEAFKKEMNQTPSDYLAKHRDRA